MRHSAKLRTFAKHQNILNILKVKVSNCYVQSTVYYVVKKNTNCSQGKQIFFEDNLHRTWTQVELNLQNRGLSRGPFFI